MCPHVSLVSAAEAGLLEVSAGDQHSSHRPAAHHWRHAEWLWGLQPEVWLRGRPRVFPRLDTPPTPAEGQGHVNTHMLRSDLLFLPSLPAKQKTCVFLLLPRRSTQARRRSVPPPPAPLPQALSWKRWPGETAPRPCRARITWLWVTSGKGHLMPWRTVAHFQQQREDPPPHSPVPPGPPPAPPTTPPSLDAPGAALNTTTEVLLCRITKRSRCYKKVLFDKTVIIIIILYNIVPFPNPLLKNLHVPQLF